MKTKSTRFGIVRSLLAAVLLGTALATCFAPPAHAEDAAPPAVATAPAVPAAGADAKISAPEAPTLSIVQGISALVVPVIVFGVRKAVPALPKLWLPVIAAGLGLLGEALSAFASGASANLWLGVVLGLAGVGVREATKQVKEAVLTPAPATS